MAFMAAITLQGCGPSAETPAGSATAAWDTSFVICTDSADYAGLKVTNKSDTLVRLTFSINNKFWFNPEQMLDYIRGMKTDSLPGTDRIITNAFRFVVENTRHKSDVPLSKAYEFSPGTFINSLGFGNCSNRAAVLALLWKNLGYKSRCVHLGGHVVPEVMDGGKWKMMDPDYNTYCLLNGSLASVDEIAVDPAHCRPVFGPGMQNLFNRLMPGFYLGLFTSRENNFVDTTYIQHICWTPAEFSLPAGAELTIPAVNPSAEPFAPNVFARLRLQKPFNGMLEIPLVLHSVRGKGRVLNPYASQENPFYHAPGTYLVKADSLELYLYLNPVLFENTGRNHDVKISCSQKNALIVQPCSFPRNDRNFAWIERYQDVIKEKMNMYQKAFEQDREFFYDTLQLRTLSDLRPVMMAFYLRSHPVSVVPDSIIHKIDLSLKIMEEHHLEKEKVFPRLQQPFHRNMLIILMLELPAEAMDRSFDYYFIK